MNDPAAADAGVWIRFEFARHVHAYLQDQIRFSDTKAGVIAAATGILVSTLRQVPLEPQQLFPPRTVWVGLEAVVIALFVLFSLLAVGNAYQVLRPRLPDSQPGAGPHHRFIEWLTRLIDRETPPSPEGGQLVNWAAISAHATTAAGEARYAREVLGTTPVELTLQLSEHSVVLAMIAGQKYQHVRLALNNLLLAAGCLVLLTLLIGFASAAVPSHIPL
jgi:hypothetical protein